MLIPLIIAFIFSASPASVGRASVFGAESPGEDSPIYLLRPGSRPLLGPTLDFPRLFTRGKGRPCFYFISFFDARVEWFDKTTRCRDCLSRYYKPTSWGNGFKLDQNKSIGHGYIFFILFLPSFSWYKSIFKIVVIKQKVNEFIFLDILAQEVF